MKLRARTIKKPRVEMMPLIDSVFLILVFFIYAFLSMTVHRGLPVNLPHAASSVIDKKDYSSITITEDNAIFLDKERIDISALRSELLKLEEGNPDVRIYINGDENAKHGFVVDVLDGIKSAGISKVSIETEGEES